MKLVDKKSILPYLGALVLTVGAAYATTPAANGDFDINGLNNQVQNHEQRLNNHDARITNTEADVTKLQSDTNTTPAPVRVEVPQAPVASAPTIASQPTNNPTKVASISSRPVGANTWCDITYTDGQTYSWQWKTVNQEPDGTHSGGTKGSCDQSMVGWDKTYITW